MTKKITIFIMCICMLIGTFAFVGCSATNNTDKIDPVSDVLVLDNPETEDNITIQTTGTAVALNSYFSVSGDRKIAMYTLAQLASNVWLDPDHMIVEVPSEMWTDGTVRWQQVNVNWNITSTLFNFMQINVDTGAYSLRIGRVSLSDAAGYTIVQVSSMGTPSVSMPAPGRVWAAQNVS